MRPVFSIHLLFLLTHSPASLVAAGPLTRVNTEVRRDNIGVHLPLVPRHVEEVRAVAILLQVRSARRQVRSVVQVVAPRVRHLSRLPVHPLEAGEVHELRGTPPTNSTRR